MTGSIKVARLGGMDIEVDYTWLFALVLVTWSLAEGYFPTYSLRSINPPIGYVGFVLAVSVAVVEVVSMALVLNRGVAALGVVRWPACPVCSWCALWFMASLSMRW